MATVSTSAMHGSTTGFWRFVPWLNRLVIFSPGAHLHRNQLPLFHESSACDQRGHADNARSFYR